jgi:DNA polymerase-3 subunit delta
MTNSFILWYNTKKISQKLEGDKMTAENLEKELKNEKLDNIYLLYGEETFLLETAVKKIKKLFGEMILGINYIHIDETNLNTLIDNVNMPAFGYSRKLIVIKNAGLFKKNMETASQLCEYMEENKAVMKETTVLLIIESADSSTFSSPTKANKLLKTIEENGTVCNFEKLKPMQIASRLKAIVYAYEVKISDDTLKYLIETSGTNMQSLINEIRKLIEYAGKGGTIAKEDVDKLAVKGLESVIFDLTDNLGKKETKKSLEILEELLYNKEPIQKILITLYNHFKKLYLVKLSEEYGSSLAETLKLRPNQMFLVTKYKRQAEYFKIEELRQILEELINLDTSYKSGLIDINIGLEAILCRYCS